MNETIAESMLEPTPINPLRTDPSANPSAALGSAASQSAPLSASQRAERSLHIALTAARIAAENRGRNVAVLDMRELTPVFDYFVIATGTSRRQLHAMSEEIDNVLEKDLGDRRLGIEGYRESRWIVLDYGDVVIHLFDEETREYYSLEQLWSQAKPVPLPEWRLATSSE